MAEVQQEVQQEVQPKQRTAVARMLRPRTTDGV